MAGAHHTLKVGRGGHATLEAARDHARTLVKDKPVVIEIAAGIYPFERPLALGVRDGGSKDNPVTYRAEPGGKVVFDGSIRIPTQDVSLVTDPAVLNKLSVTARGKVVSIPVNDAKLIKLLSATTPVGVPLLLNNDLQTPSRFPNIGFAHARELIFEDEGTRWQKNPVAGTFDKPNGAAYTLRETPAGTWQQWAQETRDKRRAICTGYLSAQWYREAKQLHSIDPEHKTVRLVDQTRYGLKEMVEKFQSRQSFMYLLCEIDSPGEWYFDVQESNLYLWPTQPVSEESRLVVAAAGGFLDIDGASHVRIEGLTVQGVVRAGAVIRIRRGEHNTIVGCTIRNSTANALNINGSNNTVHACDIYDVTGLARLSGGKATPDAITPGNNTISNCHFYLDKFKAVAPTVGISGVGQVFRNNLMHNLPGQAIVFRGNDHLIERNELFNIGFEEGDGAAIYSGAEFWGYGTRLQHNFLHHIMSTNGLMTRSGIMLDDHDSGREIIENIFYKTGHGSLAINGGTGLKVHRNVFMNGNFGVWVRIIGNVRGRMQMQAKFDAGELPRGDKHDYIWRCEQVVGEDGWNNEPWKTRYPDFPTVMNQTGEHGRFWPIENDVDGNLGHAMASGLTYRHPMIKADRLVFKNTREIEPEAIYTAPDTLDFTYRVPREAWMPDIPFEHIGLYLDEHRPAMPDKARYRPMVREYFQDRRSCDRRAKYDFDNVNRTIYWNSGALLKSVTKTKG
ncbi:MAG: right-handed parallel beta-helix repeat-containing protein [Phycisphaeraceae bacterium]|nr:right-handed parallel beta-helix repeat-containing protein [Phycisphaeraceae bacterium]